MKKILITGAAGTIGFSLIEQLVPLHMYEITALDIKSNKAIHRLKKYQKDINVIYGDITDESLVNALITGHDVVIHLCGILPPLADIKEKICYDIDLEGTQNIINAINDINPKCYLLYASSTTVYGNRTIYENIKSVDRIKEEDLGNYSLVKLKCESLIKKKLKNYVIFRLSAVLGDIKSDAPMYHIPLETRVEFISNCDAARAFIKAIEKKAKINQKIFNITGGDPWRTTFKSFLITVLKIYGISIRFLGSWFLLDKNFYSGFYADSNEAEKILNFRSDSLDNYYLKLKETNKIKRLFPRLMAKPFIMIIKKHRKSKEKNPWVEHMK